jgi:hypothetical protein
VANDLVAGANALLIKMGPDTVNRFVMDASGTMTWGPGNAGGDVNLYRSGVGQLKTDMSLIVSNIVYVGAAGDSYLQRIAIAGGGLSANGGAFCVMGQFWLQSATTGAVGANQSYRFPLYNQNGTLLGYVPIYN